MTSWNLQNPQFLLFKQKRVYFKTALNKILGNSRISIIPMGPAPSCPWPPRSARLAGELTMAGGAKPLNSAWVFFSK
jgi:hypothetical protein